jgi:hypothetical protein
VFTHPGMKSTLKLHPVPQGFGRPAAGRVSKDGVVDRNGCGRRDGGKPVRHREQSDGKTRNTRAATKEIHGSTPPERQIFGIEASPV